MQLRALELDELVQRLDRRFAVLTGGHPGALERHQTLRTAIEWSYGLCSLAERRLWARLSVFAGTFSLAAAEEVCAEVEIEQPEVVDALIGLVDKSVVLPGGRRGTGCSTRCASSAPSSWRRRARKRRAGPGTSSGT